MAINFNTKKGTEKLTDFLQKTTAVGKTAAESVQKGAIAFSEKVICLIFSLFVILLPQFFGKIPSLFNTLFT